MTRFRAWVADWEVGANGKEEAPRIVLEQRVLSVDDLPEGELLVRVAYSDVNYKDALAVQADGNVVRSYPLIPGIDFAGIVEASADSRFRPGDPIVVTGFETGVARHGGYAEYARVPADQAVPLPLGLTLREAMIFGTAGFTAALSLFRMEKLGLAPENGPVLVTGATGGVGSIAVSILATAGYEVHAGTRKGKEHSYLKQLGAAEIIAYEQLLSAPDKPLLKQLWAGAIDCVGGPGLAHILSQLKYGGTCAVSGLTGGTDIHTTVFPFILRGIQLAGIDSVYCPMEERIEVWKRLGTIWKPKTLEEVAEYIRPEQLAEALGKVFTGQGKGRTVVELSS